MQRGDGRRPGPAALPGRAPDLGGRIGWITTDRTSFKGRHLAHSPYLSLAYVSEVAKPAYADCRAEWADDPTVQRHVWDLCLNTPPPLGFDPAPIYRGIDGPTTGTLELGVIKLVPTGSC